jgi:hypothetical protein
MNNSNKFTAVAGFSDRRRIPLLGKIRLGKKLKKAKPDNRCKHRQDESCIYCTYPTETEYFVCPPEVKAVYGDTPTKLDVMLPSANRGISFPCSCRRYGQTKGLKCIGNKITAQDIENRVEKQCPCPHYVDSIMGETRGQKVMVDGKEYYKDCDEVGFLFVILPKVNLGGVYQIRTQSGNSVADVMSGMDYVEILLQRPCNMIPLVLKREKTETHHDQKRQTHYTLKLQFEGNIDFANKLIQDTKRLYLPSEFVLPAPSDENPAYDDQKAVEGIADEEKEQVKDAPDEQKKAQETLKDKPQEQTGRTISRAELKTKSHPELVKMIRELATKKNIGDLGIQGISWEVGNHGEKKWYDLTINELVELFIIIAKQEEHEKVGF